ncbi:MAG: twin-arginine translocase subunit TatC [Verrucomicrobia bacterium]|nr:twin-arginine translocase subunit TatC [Verrucomicrobiota bacterium]
MDDSLPTGSGHKSEMPLLDHLEELRWTLLKSVIAFFLACVLVAVFLGLFADLMQWPYRFATRGMVGTSLGFEGLINTSILGVFSVIFYLIIGGGFALSLPAALYFLSQYVAPALNDSEIRLLKPACLTALGLFLTGCLFSFFVLVPAALRAAILFNELLGFQPFWTASSYYALLVWMVLGVGMAFQFPLILLILIHLGILQTQFLKTYRRHSFVGFLCLGALVTPTTDPVTFILLAIPMYLLYETAIFAGTKLERWKAAQQD